MQKIKRPNKNQARNHPVAPNYRPSHPNMSSPYTFWPHPLKFFYPQEKHWRRSQLPPRVPPKLRTKTMSWSNDHNAQRQQILSSFLQNNLPLNPHTLLGRDPNINPRLQIKPLVNILLQYQIEYYNPSLCNHWVLYFNVMLNLAHTPTVQHSMKEKG